ncbi:MAG TPA: AtpZ/AtpI family protein [Firmicutes bacterium]|nr:AtpZ/AtpI family protein [Bacillota bacterium]
MAPKRNDLYVYAKYGNVALSFGFTLIFAVGGGALLGRWLDGRLQTFPAFLIIGILGGTVLAFKSLFDLLTGMQETDLAEREGVSPVYRRAMNLRRLYFKKAKVRKGENPNNKRKE